MLVAEVEALAARLEAWRRLPVLTEEYVGPVLLTGSAAPDAVRHLVARALLGTPPAEHPSTGSRVVSFDAPETSALELRRRMLPPGWSADDDPARDPRRASAYTYDWEGVPAERVSLVEDGIVRGHLMSRIPSKAFPGSNGHGRAMPGELVRAMPADLAVVPDRTLGEGKLHKLALKAAAAYGSDRYAVVTALREPSIDWMDGGPLLGSRDFEETPTLPSPLAITFVHRDGRTETFRGADLGGVDLRAFRELLGGGEAATIAVESGDGNVFSGPNTGLPVTYTAPALLFAEAVASPHPVDAERPPRLANPLAEAPR